MYSVASFVNVDRPLQPSLQQPIVDNHESPEDVDSAIIISPVPVTKPRRPRTSFTSYQLVELEKEYQIDNYCRRDRRIDICIKLKLTEIQVKTWFQNRRTKSKKQKQNANGEDSVSSYEESSLQPNRTNFAPPSEFQAVTPPTATLDPVQINFSGQHANITGNGQHWEMPSPVQNFQTQFNADWSQYNNVSYGTVAEVGYNYPQGYEYHYQQEHQVYYQQQNYQRECNCQHGCFYLQEPSCNQGYNGAPSTFGYIPTNDVDQRPQDM